MKNLNYKESKLAYLNPQKIGVLRALNLGDLLCSIPSFRALRNAYPKASITLIGLPWSKSFVKRFSKYFDEFIEFEGYPGLPEREIIPEKIVSFIKKVQKQKFDLVLQMQGNGYITNPLVSLFKAKALSGFFNLKDYCPDINLFLPYPNKEHEIRRHLKLMEFLGIKTLGEELEFPVFPYEKTEFENLKESFRLFKKNYVVIHPGARDIKKRYLPKNFALVSDFITNLGFKVVITGTKEEKETVLEVIKNMKNKPLNLMNKTSLGALSLLIKDSKLLISSDTGISHIASSVKTPSIIIFTISEEKRWAPLDTSLHKTIDGLEKYSLDDLIFETGLMLKKQNTYIPPQSKGVFYE